MIKMTHFSVGLLWFTFLRPGETLVFRSRNEKNPQKRRSFLSCRPRCWAASCAGEVSAPNKLLTKGGGGFKWSSQHSRESGAIMGARYVIGDWRAVKSALAGGATIRGAAESTGVGRGAVYLWSRRDRPPRGVIMSEVPRSAEAAAAAAAACGGREPGARLTPWDRALIHAMLLAGSSQRAIARALGCR